LANKVRGVVLAALVLVCAACVLVPGTALAGTLDQQQTNVSGGTFVIDSGQSRAQTFTAGLSGGVDRVDLNLQTIDGTTTVPLSVEIRDASSAGPGNMVLASDSVPAASVSTSSGFVSVNFATPAPVVAGTLYAIVAYDSAAFGDSYAWAASTADSYAGGDAFTTTTFPPSGGWGPAAFAPGDFAFKTYVVVPSPPPPPPPVASGPTGLRAAALRKCKHKHGHKRKKCKKRANLLPV
jgi:hypothetical protein